MKKQSKIPSMSPDQPNPMKEGFVHDYISGEQVRGTPEELESVQVFEVVLPIPKDSTLRSAIANETADVIETRAKLRDRTKAIALEVEGLHAIQDADVRDLI